MGQCASLVGSGALNGTMAINGHRTMIKGTVIKQQNTVFDDENDSMRITDKYRALFML